ncbi:hypothetical protein C7A12_07180 [Pseudomonas fluorescens]|nr:hypothetical protein C7A12_07180 [Pseudomonas fluorescens]PRW82183.1 hypothetical protein C7A13_02860 [Pseudomonas fluorescens]
MWRGSLLPLEREALPNRTDEYAWCTPAQWFGAASQPSGSKLPRHSKLAPTTSFNAVCFEAVCQRFLSVMCCCCPATSSFSAGCCWYCR